MQVTPFQTSDRANPEPRARLEELAHQLAEIHTGVRKSPKPWILLEKHLRTWEEKLQDAYQHFSAASLRDPAFSRAGEWMLDNFYVVKQTFRQIEESLPSSFINQLPKLNGTLFKGHPRIFALASEWIGYSQGQIDLAQATAFVQDYQQITPLTIGELWALPIMLRIGILERLVFAVAELTGMDTPPLVGTGNTSKGLSEIPIQVGSPALVNEIIVTNCFLGLRLLSTTDWKDFFEQISRVEKILRDDPAGIYAGMDFDTRNSYRTVIEELARHSTFSEEEVALAANKFARGVGDIVSGRKAHVGYYLRDAGLVMLENSIRYRPRLNVRIRRVLLASPTALYLGSIAILTMLFLLGLLTYATLSGGSFAQRLMVGVLGLALALEAAITFVHWNVTHGIKPQSLPRMDFSDGIPPGNRTMVVIPTLLESTGELDHLLQELELNY